MPDPSKRTAQYANMMNMASQQRAAQLQSERTQQGMKFDANTEAREAEKFGAEQPVRVAGALGGGLINILRDPSDASIMQAAKTFAAVGMEPDKFNPILQQIMDIPDENDRKLFVLEFIAQSEPARAALKFVMPDVKETKAGDDTVFTDNNANSVTFGQELFRLRADPERVKMTQNVVGSTVMNTNPLTGVTAEATIGDPMQDSAPNYRPATLIRGATSPYAVGGGAGQPRMEQPVTPTPPAAVGTPRTTPRGAPGQGNTADVVYGFGEFGLPPKPISQSTIGEVQDFQRNTLIPKTRGRVGAGPREGTGAVGTYQFTYGTLQEIAPKVLGPNWRNTTFTADVQEQLAKALYDDRKSGNLKDTWAGLPSNRPGQYTNVPWEQVRDKIINVESVGRRKPTGTPTRTGGTGTPTGGPITVSEQQRRKGFVKTLELFDYNPKTGEDSVSALIKASTSGGLEKIGSDIAGFFGVGTQGSVAIGQLEAIKDNMTFEKLRGKLGAQISDADVRLIASTMGDIANPLTPDNVRLAKWQNIVLPILVRGAGMTYVKPKGGSGGGTKVIKTLTPDQVRAAPSGTVYKTTDGRKLTKP